MDSEAPLNLARVWWQTPAGRIHGLTAAHAGAGDPVVLVHGMVVASTYMIPTAERLAASFRVFVPDLPGYGKSYKPWPILSVTGLADAIDEWMDAASIDTAHFVGNSFGCQVIAEFAARHPERVRRIVLQGPTVDREARTRWQQIRRSIRNSPNEPNSLGRVMITDYAAAGLRRAWATFRLVLSDRIEEKLPRVTAPTLVVRGANDPIVPQRWAEELTRLLPNGRLLVMPGVGHTINYTAPEAFVRVIRPFLEER